MADEKLLQYLQVFITPERVQRFEEVLKYRTRHFTVAVEDVYQLHNTSAVMRSCEVFGIQDLHVIEEKNVKRLDKEIAMGAQKWVDMHRYDSASGCIERLKDQGYKIIATTPHDDSCFLNDFPIDEKSAIFFGTEKDGLSEIVMDQADGYLKIPMVGFTESLNISVSAAIILQHITTALRESDIKWQLSEEEMLIKKIDWTKKTIKSLDQVMQRYVDVKKEL
ncbi:TrmH family RNA methyltransferase [Sungkyunkwania multivorans]|uniref:tRNA (guanosine(18)-2'-O)-methyltransferase n=1 Tax=Sungkyunkwania multivorans TaxID=1173618 RepID=A0ABW3D0F2_9FLAO